MYDNLPETEKGIEAPKGFHFMWVSERKTGEDGGFGKVVLMADGC